MLAAAWVTLKQNRFEVVVATMAALAAGIIGISIWSASRRARRDAGVPRFGAGASATAPGSPRTAWPWCGRGSGIIGDSYLSGQGTVALSIMGALPFMLGLLGGVPIVSRELESRTAQTAWSLNPSRLRWLVRQVVPVALLLGAADDLRRAGGQPGRRQDWVRWGYGGWSDLIGMHGLLAVVRAFGAFGIGLAVGAYLGRTLPAFIFGVALTLAILFGLNQARDTWLAGLPQEVIGATSPNGEYQGAPAKSQPAGGGSPRTVPSSPPTRPGSWRPMPACPSLIRMTRRTHRPRCGSKSTATSRYRSG